MRPKAPQHTFLIRRGKRIEVGLPIKTWLETAYQFLGRHRLESRIVINHWTASENAPGAVYQHLIRHRNARNVPEALSVHFIVDRWGHIHQTADTELRGAHCAALSANSYSIGIEYICRGSALDKVPSKGVVRERVREQIHGRQVTYDALTPEQIASGVLLNQTLCTLYELPLSVPETEDGRVRSSVFSQHEAERYKGCAGHLHFSDLKVDPGLGLLSAIQAQAGQPVG